MPKDQEKEKKLLPCPFCGGEAEIVSSEFGIHVKCKNEKCWNIDYHSEQQAIKAWNTRHTEPTPSKPGHCPTCGTPVKVVGKTTMHYEPVGTLDIDGILKEFREKFGQYKIEYPCSEAGGKFVFWSHALYDEIKFFLREKLE